MPIPLSAPLPLDLDLTGDYTIRLNAIDATSGATVAGVTVSLATYQVTPTGGTTEEQLVPPPLLVPVTPSV